MNSKRMADVSSMLKGLRKVANAFVRIQFNDSQRYWQTSSLNKLTGALSEKIERSASDVLVKTGQQQEVSISISPSTPQNTVMYQSNTQKSSQNIDKYIPASFKLPPVTENDLDELAKDINASGLLSASDDFCDSNLPSSSSHLNLCASIKPLADMETGRGQSVKPFLKPVSMSAKNITHIPSLADNRHATKTSLSLSNHKTANQSRTPSQRSIEHQLNEMSKERRVPAGRISRVMSFGSLAAGLGIGAVAETVRRAVGATGGSDKTSDGTSMFNSSALMSEANMDRIISTLCRVRGAALKLGQMISIQDNTMLSPQLQNAFERVRQSADFMPLHQMEKAMEKELGSNWRSRFAHFENKPFAAASIGQVHKGMLHDGRQVAVKIQYPGVAKSINSDINNLLTVLKVWQILPKGMYVENLMDVSRHELQWECDYEREAKCMKIFRKLLASDPIFKVPDVIDELSTKQVLVTDLIPGTSLDKCTHLSQETSDILGEHILRLCVTELYEWNIMQTDPNWSNFFYDEETHQIYLLDFGATRQFSRQFIDSYIQVIKAAAVHDIDTIVKISTEMGFLTGYESKAMVQAHVDAVTILGGPCGLDEKYDFGNQDITRKIENVIPVMLRDRLGPPPEETYSLHRKLSGSFLLCTKLKSRVHVKQLYDKVFAEYKFGQKDTNYGFPEFQFNK